jgi:hypothetical protein
MFNEDVLNLCALVSIILSYPVHCIFDNCSNAKAGGNKTQKKSKRSRIKFPSNEEMIHLAALVSHREPRVNNTIGFVDGVSIPVQCTDEEEDQNAAYNGYHHDTMCNNVLAFAPTGKIIHACINFPGSWHDG